MVNVYHLFVNIIVLFCCSTLTYRFWPPINRVLAVFIVGLCIYFYCRKLTKKKCILALGLISIFAFSLVMTNDIKQNLNDYLYWLVTIILCVELSDDEFLITLSNCFSSANRIMKAILIIGNFVLLIGFFLPSCYSSAWEGHYYVGFAYSQHSICCGCCILLVIGLFYFRNEKLNFSKLPYFLPASLAILQSGARTFIISLLIIWLFIYMDLIHSKNLKLLLFPIVLVLASYFILNSSMMEKFLFASTNQYTSSNKWVSFSSGRFDFWTIDITAFLNSNIINKIFGNGFSYVYEVNKELYGLYIWAHNDLIDVLLSAGIIGTLIYFLPIFEMLKSAWKIHMPKIEKIAIILYFVFPLLINGLFAYQHYLYSFLILLIYCRSKVEHIRCLSGGEN